MPLQLSWMSFDGIILWANQTQLDLLGNACLPDLACIDSDF
jgi:hypothetical protein